MEKVYLVYERLYRSAYYAEPYEEESVIKVFDDYHKTVSYICEVIKESHKELDESGDDLTHYRKHDPNPDEFVEGHYIKSLEYDGKSSYDYVSYKFVSYDVE